MLEYDDKSWSVKESVPNTKQHGEQSIIDIQMDKRDAMYVKFSFAGMVILVHVVE
jgi:hypothetical protein